MVGFASAKGALGFAGYGWGVLVGADQADLLQSVTQLRSFILAIVAGASVLVAILAMLMARGIVAPVQETVTVLEAVAGGDLKNRVRVRTRDEVGRMGEALNTALDAISQMIAQIRAATTMLAGSAEQLTASSDEQSHSAERTLQQASSAATASDEVSRNIHTVASGAEEMSASITEIAKNAADAAVATEEGSATAREANERVALLDASSREIGQVSDTIKMIAEQTNALAASATSQADQAEKASKGFAVVAYEVKDLAKQTSESTSRIETRITAIQKDTSSAMSSIGSIGSTVSRIEEISTRIHHELERAIEALRRDDAPAGGAQSAGIESLAGVVRQAKEAALVAQQAVSTIRKVDAEVTQLGKSSDEVGEVIRVIDTIARQTNLLALNAAIEAQRAGDAARGFGGVAEQVKTLARRTGDATSEIRARIDSIQGETQATVVAMREIGARVDKITDISATIASAVEQQSASAMEITRCVSDAARGAGEIAENVALVRETALGTSKAGSDTRTSAAELSRLASELQESVSRFEA